MDDPNDYVLRARHAFHHVDGSRATSYAAAEARLVAHEALAARFLLDLQRLEGTPFGLLPPGPLLCPSVSVPRLCGAFPIFVIDREGCGICLARWTYVGASVSPASSSSRLQGRGNAPQQQHERRQCLPLELDC